MIDVSDGLVQDLSHICEASGVSAMIDVASVPMPSALASLARKGGTGPIADPRRLALAGGEDYELLFTVRATTAASGRVEKQLAASGCGAHRIGRIVRHGRDAVVDAASGRAIAGGFMHFGGRK